jgi:hypothetical protein
MCLGSRHLCNPLRSRTRVVPTRIRVVIAIDPAMTSGEDADETGIVVAGKDAQGTATCLVTPPDAFCHMNGLVLQFPLTGRIARPGSLLRSATAARWSKRTIRMVEPNVPFTQARASRGKVTRAEPVAALYEQGRVQIRPTASTRSFGPFRSSWSSRSPIRDCLILSVARWRDRRGGLCGRCSRDRASRGQVDRRRRRISSEATEAR